MPKGLPTEEGWYWVKHAGIPSSLGGEPWWEIKQVWRVSSRHGLQISHFNKGRGEEWELLDIPVDRMADVEWYGPIPKPE